MYVVCVEFRIKAGQMAEFLPLMKENAAKSVRDELECHQFDVVQIDGDPDLAFLYEVYESQAAFSAHLAMDHFKDFDAATASMVQEKNVKTGTRLTL